MGMVGLGVWMVSGAVRDELMGGGSGFVGIVMK